MPTQEQLQAAAEQMARSVALLQAGRGDEALMCLDCVLDALPGFAPALIKRGSLYQALSRHDEAVADFERCLALHPSMAHVKALREGALQAKLSALDADSPDAQIHEMRAALLMRLQRDTDALNAFERAVQLEPDHVGALSGMGHALLRLQRHDEALACYDRVLAIAPDSAPEYAVTLFNRANVLQQQGCYDEALAGYDSALASVPAAPEVLIEQAHCHLVQGRFETGWPLFEARWDTRQLRGARPPLTAPMWRGEKLVGGILLLWSEQGLGDTLQFVRYLSQVAERVDKAAAIVVRVPAGLKTLIAFSVGRVAGTTAAIHVIGNDEPIPAHDCQCPLMSLPLAFGTTLQSVPAKVPYLHAPEDSISKWRDKLGSRCGKPRIGLVWAGGQRLLNNPTRDMRAAHLRPLLEIEAEWIGLQQAMGEKDRQALQDMSSAQSIHQLGDELRDFSDTAGLIEQLDAVVSVDSSVAHLAGALGKPVCLMLRRSGEWRWLQGRDESPWYPKHRLFRQPRHGEWDVVVETVAQYLNAINWEAAKS